jgi:hypothetical protein
MQSIQIRILEIKELPYGVAPFVDTLAFLIFDKSTHFTQILSLIHESLCRTTLLMIANAPLKEGHLLVGSFFQNEQIATFRLW